MLRHWLQMHPLFILLLCVIAVIWISGARWHEGTEVRSDSVVGYEGIVVSEPVIRGKVLQFDFLVRKDSGHYALLRASLLRDTVYNDWQKIQLGDGLKCSSVLELPPFSDYPYGFDQRRWLETHGYAAQTFIWYRNWDFCDVSLSDLNFLSRLRLHLLKYRHKLVTKIRQTELSEESKAVAVAMTLGDRTAISREVRYIYNVTGAGHVLALSGLHLSIIYSLLMFGFWHFKMGKTGLLVVLPFIWLYAMMTGMPVSVVRAAIMLTICALCTLTDRKAVSLNSLSLAALIILCFNPKSLWDMGFQLSFLSVFSILVFYPTFYRWLHTDRIPWLSWLSSLVAVSLSAQLGTFILLSHYFGRFSTYFLVTNLVVVPAAMLIILFSLVFFLMMPFQFLSVVSEIILQLLDEIVHLQQFLLTKIASWPCSTIEGYIPTTIVFLCYLCMFLLCLLFCNLRQGFRQARLLRMR